MAFCDDGLPIKTERLVLRRTQSSDVEAVFDIFGDEASFRFQFGSAMSLDEVQTQLESQKLVRLGDPGVPYLLVAVELATNAVVGIVELVINSVGDRQAEIGFTFNSRYGRRGLATEAVNACLGYAFSVMKMHRVFAGVDTRNERSWRLMERIGMRREAHFLHANYTGEEWIDDFIYAMLEDEWFARNYIGSAG